jgi:hypothetical protein
LESNERVSIHLIGPVDGKIPSHPRLVLHRPVRHSELAACARKYDCMLVPFKISPLIESVDPVKVYEFINYNKNIIISFYDELKRFDRFVHFYNSREEMAAIVRALERNNVPRYTEKDRLEFLRLNSWANRAQEICRAMESRI